MYIFFLIGVFKSFIKCYPFVLKFHIISTVPILNYYCKESKILCVIYDYIIKVNEMLFITSNNELNKIYF